MSQDSNPSNLVLEARNDCICGPKQKGVCFFCRVADEIERLRASITSRACMSTEEWHGHLAECDRLRAALDTLIREASAVADDHHKPIYTRLDEALASAREVIRPAAFWNSDTFPSDQYAQVPIETLRPADEDKALTTTKPCPHTYVSMEKDGLYHCARCAAAFRIVPAGETSLNKAVQAGAKDRQVETSDGHSETDD